MGDIQTEKAKLSEQEQLDQVHADQAALAEARKKWNIPERSDEQIKKLAQDLFFNNIFTSLHIRNPHDLQLVFMAVIFVESIAIKVWNEQQAVFYEYYDKSAPRSINGMPMFFSFHLVRYPDFKKALELADKMRDAVKNVK